jgi:hypothetical protein
MNITIDSNTKNVIDTAIMGLVIIAFYYFIFKSDRD